MRQQKAKKGGGEKSKSQGYCEKSRHFNLLSEHARTSQGNILLLDQGHQVYDLLNGFVVRFSSL